MPSDLTPEQREIHGRLEDIMSLPDEACAVACARKWAGEVKATLLAQPDAISAAEARGRREGVEAAAAWHDRKVDKWVKEALRHVRPGGYRSDHGERDIGRANDHQRFAREIRALVHPPAGG